MFIKGHILLIKVGNLTSELCGNHVLPCISVNIKCSCFLTVDIKVRSHTISAGKSKFCQCSFFLVLLPMGFPKHVFSHVGLDLKVLSTRSGIIEIAQ